MIQATGEAAKTVADALKNQPITLAVVVINVICMIIVGFTIYSVSLRVSERDKMFAELVQKCTTRN